MDVGVRVLAGDELEGADALPVQGEVGHEPLAARQQQIDAARAGDAVDALGGVCIERADIVIGAVRQFVREGVDIPLDDGASRWVSRHRLALTSQRHQDVAVHHPSDVALIVGNGPESGVARQRPGESSTHQVSVGRFHAADLEEGPSVEHAVLMPVGSFTVQGRDGRLRTQSQHFGGRDAVLGGKILRLHFRFDYCRRSCSDADVGLLDRPGVDHDHDDVFVPLCRRAHSRTLRGLRRGGSRLVSVRLDSVRSRSCRLAGSGWKEDGGDDGQTGPEAMELHYLMILSNLAQ